MRAKLWNKLKKLVSIPGVSGSEQEIVKYLQQELSEIGDELTIDTMGNVYVKMIGNKDGPEFLIAAHSDQIGAKVKYIDDAGFLRLEKIGGTLDSLLVGRKVKVGEVSGVIGVKPGHYQTPEEKKQVPSTKDLYIDVGADSRDEVQEMGIKIGTPVTYEDELTRFYNGDRVAGAGVDNRAGCAVLWQLLKELQQTDFGGTVWGVFSVQEEVGLRGASVAAEKIRPDFALAVDTIPCGGTPDVKNSQLHTRIGAGPVFAYTSGSRGNATMHPKIKDILISAAEKNDIPYQPMIFSGGNNDAASMQLAAEGIPAGSITLPRRYSHSPVEMADLKDMKHATKLLKAVSQKMYKIDGFSFI